MSLVAGAFLLRSAGPRLENTATRIVPTTSSETKIPDASNPSDRVAKGSTSHDSEVAAVAPNTVAPLTRKDPANAAAYETNERQKALRLLEAKNSAMKLMLKHSRKIEFFENASAASKGTPSDALRSLIKDPRSTSPQSFGESAAAAGAQARSAVSDDPRREKHVLQFAESPAPSMAVASRAEPSKVGNPNSNGINAAVGGAGGLKDPSKTAPEQVLEASSGTPSTTGAQTFDLKPKELHLVKSAREFNGDLRDLPQDKPADIERPEHEPPDEPPVLYVPPKGSVPRNASQPKVVPGPPAPGPLANFDGLGRPPGNGFPPDTNGDVGPNHYIQTINTSLAIYNKTGGAPITSPSFNTFMSMGAFGNLCDTNNFGDPVVVYDTFEDRWIISDFAFSLDGSNNIINPPGAFQCFAVSKTADPVVGGWNFYSIQFTDALNDYPKFGIWPDGLYMTANMFGFGGLSAGFISAREWAFNKAQMYAGAANPQIVVFDAPRVDVNGGTVFTSIPSNARLQTGTPPAGTPNYFAVTGTYTNALQIWKFHVDWNNVFLSTFTGPFIPLTGSTWIVPPASVPSQGGNNLDTLATRSMVQNQYSNISGAESIWLSHTVRNSTTVGVSAARWYQVDVTGGTVAANSTQAANHEPDTTTSRFMPSLAVDRAGDMMIGYSASSGAMKPAIRYAGRLVGDPLSTLPQTETDLIQGAGTQVGNCGGAACMRWGDYSAMSLDPTDGCTFWYTNQYYPADGLNYATRIGSFKFSSCTAIGNGTVQGTVTTSPGGTPINGATVAFGSRTATTNVSGFYSFASIPAGTYPSITASAAGFNSSTSTPVVVSDGGTTVKDFALTSAPASACLTDTSQADFSLGIPSKVDLVSSPGDGKLATQNLDQLNAAFGGSGVGITITTWGGQSFTPSVSGLLTRADINLFCSGCTGTIPNLTLSVRATTAGLPTGADLATATITGFSSGAAIFYTATFSTPATLTAGTQYALAIRPTANPSLGTYALTRTGNSTTGQDIYAGGSRLSGAISGTVWTIPTTGGITTDSAFRTYMTTPSGTFVSSLKDSNPATGIFSHWTALSWNAATPANTTLQFQVAGSNNAAGPFNFVGPDGTAGTFYTTSPGSLFQFDNLRYLKYKSFLSTTDNTVTPTVNDVTVCFANSSSPTEVRLNSFTATPTDDGRVLVQWRTGTEVDNLGFNVYREVDGARTRITPQLVAGSALLAGADIKLTSGNAYAWSDTPPAAKTLRYILEDIDLNGKSTLSSPIGLSDDKSAPTPQQSRLLTSLGLRQAQLNFGLGSVPYERSARIVLGDATQPSPPFPLAGGAAVKLAVNREGWYRITQPELVAAGLDPNVDPRLLQLFVDGHEVPIALRGVQNGKFGAAASVGFYGVGLDAASSDTRVYWLAAGALPGQRIEKLQTKGSPTNALSFDYTVERKDRTIYFSGLRNGDAENFFGAVVAREPVDQTLSLRRVNKVTLANAHLEIAMQGVTQQPHRVKVILNGSEAGSVEFDGQAKGIASLAIPHSSLLEGENVVRLISQAGETDVSLVDSIRISYQHTYNAENDALKLMATAAEQITIAGFTTGDIQVFDVTNPDSIREVSTVVQAQKGGYSVTTAAPGNGQRTLLALTGAGTRQVLSARANRPTNWRQPSNGANLLIITHRNFASSAARLKALRQSQGLSVQVIDAEDIYDEFSYGHKAPQAIRDFLAYAKGSWKKPPQYALLVGDASLDPKNYLGYGDSDFVPTRLIDTQYLETASDDWLADFSGAGVADLAIGRLPVRTAQEATAMINKIVSYNSGAPSSSVLLVADRNDGFDFESSNALLRNLIPRDLRVQEVDRNLVDDVTARTQLLDAINNGQKIVNYAGHGSVDIWRGHLLTNEDALTLTNSSLPLFITMTCLNGYYQDPALDGLAESLMKSSRGGAVAVWASSGMTLPSSQIVLNERMYRFIFDANGSLTIGEATLKAKAAVNDPDVRRTWILFGDPSMRLR